MKPEYYRAQFKQNFDKAGELIREAEARGEYNRRDLAVLTEIHQRHIDILTEAIDDIQQNGLEPESVVVKIDGVAIKFKTIEQLAEAVCNIT